MISRANGRPISITGLGCHVPERVLTNDELAGDRRDERRVDPRPHRDPRAPHRRRHRGDVGPLAAGVPQGAGDGGRRCRRASTCVIVATVTPDMAFPATAALLADELGHAGRGRLRPLGRLHRASCTRSRRPTACSPRASRSARSSSAATCSRSVLDWTDRSTLVLFGDGAGAVVMEPVERGGFLGFELGADGAGGPELLLPASGSRLFNGDAERS